MPDIQSSDRRGLHSILRLAWVYELFQRSVGKNKLRRKFVDHYVKPAAGQRILDIGCGPGDLVPFVPGVDFVGYDISSSYIRSARKRHGSHAAFHDGDIDALFPELTESVDVAVTIGVLHHVPDDVAIQLADAAKRSLRDGGRFIAVEPHLYPGQHWIARELITRDRGQHVRSESAYRTLLAEVFDDIEEVRDERLLRVPYTLTVYVCR